MDFDETIITILDDEGQYEDIGIFMDETEVYIRQCLIKTKLKS